jgi:hypothetical protein
MRFIIRALFPTEAGNKMVKDPKFIQNIEGIIKNFKAEAVYFTEINGDRATILIVDMQSVDMMPAVAEPLFMMGAKVEFHPAMTIDDLRKGIPAIIKQ